MKVKVRRRKPAPVAAEQAKITSFKEVNNFFSSFVSSYKNSEATEPTKLKDFLGCNDAKN